MQFKVTKKHIKNGEQGNAEGCPVFLCLNEKTKGLNSVYTYVNFNYTDNPEDNINGISLPTPEGVRKWIYKFDDGHPMEPMTFELDIPHTLLK